VAAEAIADDALDPDEDAFLVGLLESLGLFLLAHSLPRIRLHGRDQRRGIDIATAALESLRGPSSSAWISRALAPSRPIRLYRYHAGREGGATTAARHAHLAHLAADTPDGARACASNGSNRDTAAT
jgi:hypothetical protein